MITEVGMLEVKENEQSVFIVSGDNPFYHRLGQSLFDIISHHAKYEGWKPSFSEEGKDGIKRYYFWREVP